MTRCQFGSQNATVFIGCTSHFQQKFTWSLLLFDFFTLGDQKDFCLKNLNFFRAPCISKIVKHCPKMIETRSGYQKLPYFYPKQSKINSKTTRDRSGIAQINQKPPYLYTTRPKNDQKTTRNSKNPTFSYSKQHKQHKNKSKISKDPRNSIQRPENNPEYSKNQNNETKNDTKIPQTPAHN